MLTRDLFEQGAFRAALAGVNEACVCPRNCEVLCRSFHVFVRFESIACETHVL